MTHFDAEAKVAVSRIAHTGNLDTGKTLKWMAWNSLFAMMLILSTAGLCRAEPQIGKDELKELLGNPGIYIIDIRSSEEWDHFPYKIPGAVHESIEELHTWVDKYPKDGTIIVYCA